jgi:type IV secretion system protein TrbF
VKESTKTMKSGRGVSGNPYVVAREEWNERYHDLLAGQRNWRLIAVLVGLVAFVAVLGLVVTSSKPKVIPYVIEVDKLGNVVGQGVATQTTGADDRLKRAALFSWVRDWRMVSSDPQVEKAAISRVYALIGSSSPASMRISGSYRDSSPLKLAQTETITVDVNAIYAASKESYEVDWTETVFDLKGEQVGAQRYKGVITISINPSSDEKIANLNPLGIYVTDISWSKVL